MPELLALPTFREHLGETFDLHDGAGAVVPLKLAEAQALANPRSVLAAGTNTMRDEPFSLLFRAGPGVHLPQRTYTLEHGVLGRLDVFLVPLGPDREGARFEAIFT